MLTSSPSRDLYLNFIVHVSWYYWTPLESWEGRGSYIHLVLSSSSARERMLSKRLLWASIDDTLLCRRVLDFKCNKRLVFLIGKRRLILKRIQGSPVKKANQLFSFTCSATAQSETTLGTLELELLAEGRSGACCTSLGELKESLHLTRLSDIL